ncbi:MAG: DUF1778 domain-containing protein [Thermoguttaceae bacterium]
METTITEPRGRGRPATGQTPKRYFRVDDETWAKIVHAAELNRETASEYMRRVLVKDASRVIQKQA